MNKGFLIVGGGLAGCAAAWELHKRGQTFCLIDDPSRSTSSQIAAGIINPITGRRFVLIDRFEEWMAAARSFYREVEKTLGATYLKKIPVIRIFKDAKQHQFWNEMRAKPEQLSYPKRFTPAGVYSAFVRDDFGSITYDGYHVDGAALIQDIKKHFEKDVHNAAFDPADLDILEDGVVWQGQRFDKILFAEGYRAEHNPYFEWIPFKSAKGEILIIETEEMAQPQGILNFGKWMQPLGNNRWKVGATFQWEYLTDLPSLHGLTELTQALQKYCRLSYTIITQSAGIRPAVRDLQPLLGTHPEIPRMSIFNGLGTKGFLYAPPYAALLCDALLEQKPLPTHLSVHRFLSN